jgi:hypothetical protein
MARSKKVLAQFWIDPEDDEKIEHLSTERGIKRSAFLRELIKGIDKSKEELIAEIAVLKSKAESEDTDKEKEISLDEVTKRFVNALKEQGFFDSWAKKPYVPIDSIEPEIKNVLVNMGKNPTKGNITRIKNGIISSYDDWKREYNLKNINVSYIYHGKNQDYPDDRHGLLKDELNNSQAQNTQENSVKVNQ